jgi:hypothetical protein
MIPGRNLRSVIVPGLGFGISVESQATIENLISAKSNSTRFTPKRVMVACPFDFPFGTNPDYS